MNNKIKDFLKCIPYIFKKQEKIVVDSSYLFRLSQKELEKLFLDPRIVIPSSILTEIKNGNKNKNYIDRVINRLILNMDLSIETPDTSIELDPMWKRDVDYYVVNVGVKLKNNGFKVYILTNDLQEALKAWAYKIKRANDQFAYILEDPKENTDNISNQSDTVVISEIRKEVYDDEITKTPDTDLIIEIAKEVYNEEVTEIFNTVVNVSSETTELSNDNVEIIQTEEIIKDDEYLGYQGDKYHLTVYSALDSNVFWKLIIKRNSKYFCYLQDTFELDKAFKVWTTSISPKGNKLDFKKIAGIGNYPVNKDDEVILFKAGIKTLHINIGHIENYKFISTKEDILNSIDSIQGYDLKYHKIIREAYQKLHVITKVHKRKTY